MLFHNPRPEGWPILLTPPETPCCLTKGLGKHFWQLGLILAPCRDIYWHPTCAIPAVLGAVANPSLPGSGGCALSLLTFRASCRAQLPWAEVLLLWPWPEWDGFSAWFVSSCSNQWVVSMLGSFPHSKELWETKNRWLSKILYGILIMSFPGF